MGFYFHRTPLVDLSDLERPQWQESISKSKFRDPTQHIAISGMQGLQRVVEAETFFAIADQLAADPLTALEQADLMASGPKPQGCDQPREPTSYNHDVHGFEFFQLNLVIMQPSAEGRNRLLAGRAIPEPLIKKLNHIPERLKLIESDTPFIERLDQSVFRKDDVGRLGSAKI